jgi:predicted site-specific integrase-resolvase
MDGTMVKTKEGVEKLYSIQGVKEKLGVSDTTVYKYINSGVLKASKIGREASPEHDTRQWRVKESDLNKFMESNDDKK